MHSPRIDNRQTLYQPQEAERIAAQLSAADEEFTYMARHFPSGWSSVEAYDRETGEHAGNWTN